MRIVDRADLGAEGALYTVEVGPDLYVDVKACGDQDVSQGLVYVMQNEDGSSVYAGTYPPEVCCSDFAFDEKAVVKLVSETVREFGGKGLGVRGVFPMPSLLRAFREDVLAGRTTIREAAYELGYRGWMKVYDGETTRALLQLPREKMLVAIESTNDCSEPGFYRVLKRDGHHFTGEIQDFYRIVCVNDLARIGALFSVVDDRIFGSEEEALAAVEKNSDFVLVGYDELKRVAIDYVCGKPMMQRAEGVVADVLADAVNRAQQGYSKGREIEL